MVIDLTSTSSQTMAREKVSAQRTAGTVPTNAAPAKPNGSQDTFELSQTAKALANADAIIADSPDINSDKVDSIKAAIADGSYKIDYQSVAQSMLNFESQIS